MRVPGYTLNFDEPPFDVVAYSEALVRLMRDAGGIGLSSTQVEDPDFDDGDKRYRIFSMRSDPNIVCINPRIVHASEETVYLDEGCLTFPGLYIKIKRPAFVRARFQQPNGETVTAQYHGMAARVFQHELDHLDGVLFMKRATRFHLDQASRHREKLFRRMKQREKRDAQSVEVST